MGRVDPGEPARQARRARDALARAGSVTLLIDGVGAAVDSSTVLLHDDGGRPTFVCPAGSTVAVAAQHGRPAVLRIPVPDSDRAVSVAVAGWLARIGRDEVDGDPVDVVGLEPASVLVEFADPDGRPADRVSVPLELYRSAGRDDVDDRAARLVAHTNAAHQNELREFVAGHTGTAPGEIAGVALTELGAEGTELRWVSRHGSHLLRLRFPRRAETAIELAEQLQTTLARRRQPGPLS
jgi:hypothetical protein